MSKIAIIGASRGVGLLTVQQALKNGHKVTSLSRTIESLPENINLTKIQGSVISVTDIKKTIEGADSIIVSLGLGTKLDWNTITKKANFYSEAARSLIEACKETKTNVPMIVLTGFGAGGSDKYMNIIMRIFFNLLLKNVYADKTDMEKIITNNYNNWEIVRPGRLIDNELTGKYKQYTTLELGMKVGAISRADVAHYMVSQAENATNIKKYVSIG